MSKYGENIKKIRSVRGLTQSHLADMIDVSRAVVSSYEEGRAEPRIETIIKTAEIFQVSIDTLLKSNITVNQLSGFAPPDLAKQTQQMEAARQVELLSAFFPAGLVILKSEQIASHILLENDELIFGVSDKAVKGQLTVIEHNGVCTLGEVKSINEQFIVLDSAQLSLSKIKRIIKVIGIYKPVEYIKALDAQFLKIEKRFSELESRIEKAEKNRGH